MKINNIEATFENGDMLTLSLKESTFAGFKPTKLFELVYREKIMHDSKPSAYKEDPVYFVAVQTEYFPEHAFSLAYSAFGTRLSCSNPKNESDQGYAIADILEKL